MNKKLNYEIAKQYYKLAPRVSFSTYFLLAVIIYFFRGLLPADLLVIWSVTVFLMATLFLVVIRLFKHYGNEGNASAWLTIGVWAAVRPCRKKAVFPYATGMPGFEFRYAGLQFSLRILPELDHVASSAGSQSGSLFITDDSRRNDTGSRQGGRRDSRQHI